MLIDRLHSGQEASPHLVAALCPSFGCIRKITRMAEMLTPPDPVVLDRPGTLRWAAGQPDGPRSLTWSVIGGGDDSVYVGTRSTMHEMKLSLQPQPLAHGLHRARGSKSRC